MPDIFVILVIIGSSIFAGLTAGMLGIGGGVIIVPVLYQLLNGVYGASDHNIHIAVTVSLANIAVTGSVASYYHITKQNFDKEIFFKWLLFIAIGAFLGGFGSFLWQPVLLVRFFAFSLIFLSFLMWRHRPFQLSEELINSDYTHRIFAFFNGFFSSVVGIGGGSLTVPFLTGCRTKVHMAIGTSSGFGVVIALCSLPGHILSGVGVDNLPLGNIGYLNIFLLLPIVFFSSLMAPFGALIIAYISPILLRRLFSIFLLINAIKMLLDSF